MATTTAYLGTGLLGTGFVRAAITRGEKVRVWNRTLAKAQPLAGEGAVVCERADEAVRGAQRVHLVVSDDSAVEAILSSIIPALSERAVILDHSTTLPRTTAERVARLAQRGVRFLHAPVFMSPEAARTAKGMMLVAGPEPVFRSVESDLAKATGDVWYMGEQGDRAATFKLLGNSMIITLAAGLADMFTVAKGAGVEPVDARALFSRFKIAGAIDVRGARMARGEYDATFETTMARKDVRLMLETAGDAPLAVLPSIAARMDQLIAAGHGRDDVGVMALGTIPRKV